MKYTGFERISGRFNNEFKLFNDRLKIGENATLSHAWGTSVTNNAALGGMLYNAYKTVLPLFTIWTGISAATRSPTSPTR